MTRRIAPAFVIRARSVLLLLAAALLALPACQRGAPRGPLGRHPWIVVGIDGGEWSVIRDLWPQGRLPHLRALAERGVTATLRTHYNSSPVIWTTIATGMRPEDHGITDFVVPTPAGDVPVSSTLRRVPALWNMLSRAHRRVAVLGWWASWPAEQVEGIVVSDRAVLDVERRVYPEDLLPRVLADLEAVAGDDEPTLRQDRLVARLAPRLAARGDDDLLLVYFRGVDIVSHNHWKHYRPEELHGDPPPAKEVAAFGDRIPREYEAVDRALGKIVAAAPESNVLVISDHGFRAARHEIAKVLLDFDRVLERLGYLVRRDAGIDFSRSRLYTYASPDFRQRKQIRFALAGREPGGRVRPEERAAIRARLAADLARVTYGGGEPVFQLGGIADEKAEKTFDFAVRVRLRGATKELLLDGDPEPLAGAVAEISRVSGTHGESTDGILLAAGPDVDAAAHLDGIDVHDVTPTLLYGLALPVAENFAGRAWTELFSERFRRAHPLRTIAAWGVPRDGVLTPSAEDEEIVRELGALGYLD